MTESATLITPAPQFFDAAIWRNLPSDADLTLYCDGEFAAPKDAAVTLRAKETRQITVTGDWRNASIVDYEKFNPVYNPPGLRGFVRGRRSVDEDAILYFNESTAAEAISALRDFGNGTLLAYRNLYYWIATLDGIERSAEELVTLLADKWDAPEINLSNLWGNQFGQGPAGAYDISNRFLPWRP